MHSTALDRFLGRCSEQAHGGAIDPKIALDDAIRDELDAGTLDDVARHLDDLLELSADEVTARDLLSRWLGDAGPPDGRRYGTWLVTVRDAVRGAPALTPGPTPRDAPGADGSALPRASRFTDRDTANKASTEVLRRNERQFRAWASDHGGLQRQHYYAELGREIGAAVHRAGADATHARSACTAAVLVMAVDPETTRPFILTSYPEIALEARTRERFPDLCHWFGGYFGQDHEHPWRETRSANVDTRDPARSRVRSQLDALLSLDDDRLTRAVDALGSYVVPGRMRAWVEATRWRLDACDWLA